MKTRSLIQILIFFGVLSASNQLWAQEFQTGKPTPLMIIKVEGSDLQLRLEPGTTTNDHLKDLDVDLIRSVDVIKGDSAVARYGLTAKDGVVVVMLKQRALKELPENYLKMLEREFKFR
jgi:hypothetical protein